MLRKELNSFDTRLKMYKFRQYQRELLLVLIAKNILWG